MPKVFISYVRENREEVQRLAGDLCTHGIEVWLDKNDIQPGSRWKNVIRKAISQGDFFIACFSSEYSERSRTYMNEELTLAVEELRKRPTDRTWFIPVLLSDIEIPDLSIGAGETLRAIQGVELYHNWDDGINRILAVIQPDSVDKSSGAGEAPRLDLWPINGAITGNYNLQRGGTGRFYIRLEFMIRSNVQQTIRTLKVQYFEGRSDDPYGYFAQRVKIDNEEWLFSGDDNLVPPLECKPLQRYTFWYWAELYGHDTVVGPEGTDYGRGRLRIGATGSELETYFYLNPGGEMLLSEDGWIGPQKYYST
jgi:hypothetical protein